MLAQQERQQKEEEEEQEEQEEEEEEEGLGGGRAEDAKDTLLDGGMQKPGVPSAPAVVAPVTQNGCQIQVPGEWVPVVLALLVLLGSSIAVSVPSFSGESEPKSYSEPSEMDANILWAFCGVVAGFVLLCCVGKALKSGRAAVTVGFIAWIVMSAIVVALCMIAAKVDKLNDQGITYETLTLVLGLIMGNVLPFCGETAKASVLDPLLAVGEKGGEYYIKVALQLLGLGLGALASAGLKGFVLGWVGTPIVLCCGYMVMYRWHGQTRELSLVLSAATSICGASAATAVGDTLAQSVPPDSTLRRSISGSVVLSIATLTTFTVAQVFLLPLFVDPLHVFHDSGGAAWLGSTVDSTGFVVAAASRAGGGSSSVDTAAAVKLIQNCLLAPVCVALVVWLRSNPLASDDGELYGQLLHSSHGGSSAHTAGGDPQLDAPAPTTNELLAILWKRTPKFVLGFLVVTFYLSAVPDNYGDQVHSLTAEYSRVFFAMGFFHIGLATQFSTLKETMTKSGTRFGWVILSYITVQTIDLVFKGLLTWVLFQRL